MSDRIGRAVRPVFLAAHVTHRTRHWRRIAVGAVNALVILSLLTPALPVGASGASAVSPDPPEHRFGDQYASILDWLHRLAGRLTDAATAPSAKPPAATPTPTSPPSGRGQATPTPIPLRLIEKFSSGTTTQSQEGFLSESLGCDENQCVFEVGAGSDDAGTEGSACMFATDRAEIYFGQCGSYQGIVSGFRFTNVTIPQGKYIAGAYLNFTVDGPYTNEISVDFYAEASSNAATFSVGSPPSSRALTTAFSTWHVPPEDQWELGEERPSSDLAEAIREVINRPDWSSGNALAVIVKNHGGAPFGHRRVIAYERLPLPTWHRAQLVVLFSMTSEFADRSTCKISDGIADPRECPNTTTENEGRSVNSRSGALDYAVGDISIDTLAGPLVFQRTYSSVTIAEFTTLLGYGWTHNHDTRLIFPGDPGGVDGEVLFKAHSANEYEFIDNGDGTYSPTPGLTASLLRNAGPPVTYTLTDQYQRTYEFSADGKIKQWRDAQDHGFSYAYDGNGRLDRVSDESGSLYLQLHYDAQGRIDTVTDHASRQVGYGYDAAGDLTTVTDVLQKPWTYTYENHLLTRITDPGLRTLSRIVYDQGRAKTEYDGLDQIIVDLTYNADGTTTVVDALGNSQTHTYDGRNTIRIEQDDLGGTVEHTYDFNLRPSTVTDENSNETQLVWSEDGANLEQVVDPLLNSTTLEYDSLNNLRQVTDARENVTVYTYNETDPDPARRTLLLSADGPLPGVVDRTTYTYTTAADAPQPPGLLKTITDPLGHITSFTYDALGRRLTSTAPGDRTTHYTYDSVGRLEIVEDPLNRKDWTCFDAAGRVIRSVQNASGDGGTPQTDPCDSVTYQPSGQVDEDRITSTVYDDSGNVIATIDPAGIITRTYFDADNRPYIVVQNLDGPGIYDPAPQRDPDEPNKNLRTDTTYDNRGRVIATTDPLGIITRTYYDDLDRPTIVIQNFVSGSINDPPPAWSATYPDRNVRTESTYDAAGNLIATKDNSNVITRTYYDDNNRPMTVVQNLVGHLITDPAPNRDPGNSTENLRTDMAYDAAGNQISTTDPMDRLTCTWFDAANRPQLVLQNLVPKTACSLTAPAYDPDFPDQNVRSEYFYDDAGNQIAIKDTLGVITRTYYDNAGRAYLVVQNFTGPDLYAENPPAYDPQHPDENVRTETVFDAAGQAIASIDTHGVITRTYFDELGRPTIAVRNFVSGSINDPPPAWNPTYPDRNVRSETIYDGRGDAIAVKDNANIITRTFYDDLHRATWVAQNLVGQDPSSEQIPSYDPDFPDQNVLTQTVYSAAGAVVRTADPVGQVAHSCYDGQGRLVKSVVNPSVSDPCGSYSPSGDSDRDVTTRASYDRAGNRRATTDPNGKQTTYLYDALGRLTSEDPPVVASTAYGYDAAGNRTSMTDAEGVITRYEYDSLGRLTAVVENYRVGLPANDETNVRTEYAYDGVGNRTRIVDARTYPTSFTYDDLGRLLTEQDTLGHTWTYGYDGLGNRTSLHDANGANTGYDYDDLGRLTNIDYELPDGDIAFAYDRGGNRSTMTDGSGPTSWEYDALNRPIAISQPIGGTVGYAYDGAGNRTGLTYPDLRAVQYEYDLAGRMRQVTDWDTLLTTYTYDKLGRQTSASLPNGLVSSSGYDDAGRLLSLMHVRAGQTLASYSYTYDDVGNRRQATETLLLPQPPSDLIFADGFEAGDFSAWSSATTDGGDLSVSTGAAIAGTKGMQAVLDDNNSIYVTDQTPESAKRYRSRFYFDPNSIPMANANAHILFQGLMGTTAVVQIEFRKNQGDYQVRASLLPDGTSTFTNTLWFPLRDHHHYIEIDWRASAAPTPSTGGLTLWIDGVQKADLTGIDNDTRAVDLVRLGAVTGVDTGTRGTYFFDAFESRAETAIGADPGAPAIPAPPTPPDAIFANGFESGNLAGWSANANDGGDLSATAQAAIGGSYGLQAVLDDNNLISVTDWSPFQDTRYRARFYFDPNSIPMASGNAHYLLYAADLNAVVVARLEFRFIVGDYQVRVEAVNNASAWTSTPWTKILDRPTFIELDWRAATGPGTADGGLTLWIDGTQIANFANLDNNTRRVDYVQLGAVAGVDTGTRGTEYFDAFESRRQTSIGQDPAIPSQPPPPVPPDLMFADGFESGSFSAWSASTTDTGDLSVSAPAAMVGTKGMQALLDDNVSIFVTDWTPSNEPRYRARFYFDPNSIPMTSGEAHYLLYAQDYGESAATVVSRVELRFYSGAYQIRASLVNNTTGWTYTPWQTISDAPHYFEIDWRASTGSPANGSLTLWIDGVQKDTRTGIANDTRRVDYVQWGAVAGVDTGTRGTYFMDAYKSHRETYIGPDSGFLMLLVPEEPPTETATPTLTAVPEASATPTAPTETVTPTATITETPTSTESPTSTVTETATSIAAAPALRSVSLRLLSGGIAMPLAQATVDLPTPTSTETAQFATDTATPSLPPTVEPPTATDTPVPTDTPSLTVTAGLSATPTPSPTGSATLPVTPTVTETSTPTPTAEPTEIPVEGARRILLGLPKAFVPNRGQADRAVEFMVHGLGGDRLFFTPNQVVLVLPPVAPALEASAEAESENPRARALRPNALHPFLRLQFEGANRTPAIVGVDQLPGTVNYLIGDKPSNWQTNLPTFGGIVYRDLYPGIDLRYEGTEGTLKGTFLISPGADPFVIQWRYSNARNLWVDPQTGDLIIELTHPGCEAGKADCPQDARRGVLERAPLAWQATGGELASVLVRYQLLDKKTVGLVLGDYDPALPLIIDPTLAYSTYLGGSGYDVARAIAVDSTGAAYVTGATDSTDFPTQNPIQSGMAGQWDVFVTKLNPAGSALVYSTYLGGSGGDAGDGIAVDSSGNAYVAGSTSSNNYPTFDARQPSYGGGSSDAFVSKLNPTGSAFGFSTYHGGSSNDDAFAIAVNSGEAYVTGVTGSANFPTVNPLDPMLGLQDAFVSKFGASGALSYSTYLGGSSWDEGYAIAVDPSGNAYVTGYTNGAGYPTFNPLKPSCDAPRDAFVSKLAPSGTAFVFSTCLGGSGSEYGNAIAADAAGNAYVSGSTTSADFPTITPLQPAYGGGFFDAFVTKYDPTGSAYVFSTYLGGSGDDQALAIGVDLNSLAHLAGQTTSTDFPAYTPIQAVYGGGSSDGFVSVLSLGGTGYVYSTYLGGESSDSVLGLAVDALGSTYVAGETSSGTFPTVNPLYPGYSGGYSDAFVSKIDAAAPPPEEAIVITYDYDPLYRLTAADYDDGTYFHYTYDAVGNRRTEVTQVGSTTYDYDNANRLTWIGATTLTWDDNGHLLNDGTSTYTYDKANRLASVVQAGTTYGFTYSGLGDRVRQTVAGTPTNYTLDLASGLTQVLTDGTNAYLYGTGRVGQELPGGWQYHMPDALGSVRQLADTSGTVTLTRGYRPYGDPLSSAGSGASMYGFAAEQRDGTGLVYLRARYLAPSQGRFLSRDEWAGSPVAPLSLNHWIYAYANPTNRTDPSGNAPRCDKYQRADLTKWFVDELNATRRTAIAESIRSLVQRWKMTSGKEEPLPGEVGDIISMGVGGFLFFDVVKPSGIWDFKNRIYRLVGSDIVLSGKWYKYDVPGNIHFGFLGLDVGFSSLILHCGADFANDHRPCSGSDPQEDYEAIEAGIDLRRFSGGGDVNEFLLSIAMSRHGLARGVPTEPNIGAYLIDWPYPIGTFDDGSSGIVVRHR